LEIDDPEAGHARAELEALAKQEERDKLTAAICALPPGTAPSAAIWKQIIALYPQFFSKRE